MKNYLTHEMFALCLKKDWSNSKFEVAMHSQFLIRNELYIFQSQQTQKKKFSDHSDPETLFETWPKIANSMTCQASMVKR